MQGIFFIFGIFSAFSVKNSIHIETGTLAMIFHFLLATTELTIPIFLIVMSDLALNTDIVEGTLMTRLLVGKSPQKLFVVRFLNFTLFIVIQFFIAGLSLGIGDGLISGRIGLEGLKSISVLPSQITSVGIASGIIMNLLKSLVFVSLAIFISTIFPGKLFVGTIVSLGVTFTTGGVLEISKDFIFTNKTLLGLAETTIMSDLKKSWWFAIVSILVLWLLSYLRIERIKLTNQGV